MQRLRNIAAQSHKASLVAASPTRRPGPLERGDEGATGGGRGGAVVHGCLPPDSGAPLRRHPRQRVQLVSLRSASAAAHHRAASARADRLRSHEAAANMTRLLALH